MRRSPVGKSILRLGLRRAIRVPSYSFSDVLRHTGATRNQLIRWTDLGVINAASGGGLGTGHHRRFSLINLVEVSVATELAAFRIATPKLRQFLMVVPLAVNYRCARLWFGADGRLNSMSNGGGDDPFVKKVKGLFGIALEEILHEIERNTGETFPKGERLADNDKSLLEFHEEFAKIQPRKRRR